MFVVVCVSLISILRSWLLLFGRPAAQDLIARHDVNRSRPIRDDRSPRSLSGMRQVVLLRGVNVGGRNKLAMPALRAALELAGMENVTTYVQSGNVVLDSAAKPDALARACEAVIAERDGAPVGMALFFHNFSTWTGWRGLYLEDLYVTPEARGLGVGAALLRHLAGIAVDRGCTRFEWAVLDWNQRAIDFYKAMGAEAMDDWTVNRVSGDALTRLAGRG